jgi:hypothetical protein
MRNIVTSTWTRRQYEDMDEEHSDEYMDDTIKQYEERSDDTNKYNSRGGQIKAKPSQKATF